MLQPSTLILSVVVSDMLLCAFYSMTANDGRESGHVYRAVPEMLPLQAHSYVAGLKFVVLRPRLPDIIAPAPPPLY